MLIELHKDQNNFTILIFLKILRFWTKKGFFFKGTGYKSPSGIQTHYSQICSQRNIGIFWGYSSWERKALIFFSYFIGFFFDWKNVIILRCLIQPCFFLLEFVKVIVVFFSQFWKMMLGYWYLLIGHVSYFTHPYEKYSIIMHLM